MKAILISILPKWVEKIASGEKTIVVRKTRPKIETPFKCYIYATKPKKYYKVSRFMYTSDENLYLVNGKIKMANGFKYWASSVNHEFVSGKVIGEFVCDRIDEWKYLPDHIDENEFEYYIECKDGDDTCLAYDEIYNYGKGKTLYGWHISKLKIYDKPKELREFWKVKCTNKKGGCIGCEAKPSCIKTITRPPQSWCYVEENEV